MSRMANVSTLLSLGNNEKSVAMIKLLLSDDRTYPAIDGNTPLKRAITIHNILAVELLLANVEVLEEPNESDLELAEQQPYVDRQVETLIRAALERKSDR